MMRWILTFFIIAVCTIFWPWIIPYINVSLFSPGYLLYMSHFILFSWGLGWFIRMERDSSATFSIQVFKKDKILIAYGILWGLVTIAILSWPFWWPSVVSVVPPLYVSGYLTILVLVSLFAYVIGGLTFFGRWSLESRSWRMKLYYNK